MKHEEITHKIIGCAMNYCQAFNLPQGLLINFGAKSLEFKRVYNVNHPNNLIYIKNNPKILKS